MKINQTKLKVKIKHLATEPAIIRKEERKKLAEGDYYGYQSLYGHRIKNVRQESRATQLVYGLLRGKSYASIERNKPLYDPHANWPESNHIINRMSAMIDTYGDELVDKLPAEIKKEIRMQSWQDRQNVRRNHIANWIVKPWIAVNAE